jgi:DNA-binding beta-propeller fold protein YncE
MRAFRWISSGAALLCVLAFAAAPAGALEMHVLLPTSFSPFGSFSHPTGVAVDESTGEVFIADGSPADVVDIFDAKGSTLLGTLSGAGGGTFDFEAEPVGVAVDNDSQSASFQDVYVTDVEHSVVDKFKRTGPGAYEYVCQFNGWYGAGEEACHASGGVPAEQFVEPVGAAVDVQGDVYISSYNPEHGAVDEFDAAGKGIMQVKAPEHPLLSLEHPQGLAVDAGGDLFVRGFEHGESVAEFKRSSLTGLVAPGDEQEIASSATSIAIEPSTNDLYVGLGPKIAEYQPVGAGTLARSLEFGSGILGDSLGIAANEATHVVYATDAGSGDTSAFAPATVILPDVKGGCVASEIAQTTVKLSGEVDPLGTAGAHYTIEYGPTESYGQQAGEGELTGTGFMPVSAEITGLAPGTAYHCRISTTDSEGIADGLVNHGPDGLVETLPLLPVVDEFPASASEVTTDSVIFNGFVNPGNGPTAYHFAYGLQTGHYTQILPGIGIGTGIEPITVEQAPTSADLTPGTTYHFALIATNAAGTTVGEDETFTTLPASVPPTTPLVETGSAEAVSQSSAVLTGAVDPEGQLTLYEFELGPTTAYGDVVFGSEAGREHGGVEVAQAVGSLQPGVTYHYRLVAFSVAGIAVGADRIFTTAAPSPSGVTQPATLPILSTPVFPPVKYPVVKPPKKRVKTKKHPKHKRRAKAKKHGRH